MKYEIDIYLLSSNFINDYPSNQYPELMYKQGRPYSCLLIETNEDYFVCVPFRSAISHKNAFLFQDTKRSIRTKSGLDYSKIVLIKNTDYLDDKKAIVDQDEYNETMRNLPIIVSEVHNYLTTYINHVSGNAPIHPEEFSRKYKFSTLRYFHDIMELQ